MPDLGVARQDYCDDQREGTERGDECQARSECQLLRSRRRSFRRRCRRITPIPNQTNAPSSAEASVSSQSGHVKPQNRKSRRTLSVFWSMKMSSRPTPEARRLRQPRAHVLGAGSRDYWDPPA
jgi:hypothetical protein